MLSNFLDHIFDIPPCKRGMVDAVITTLQPFSLPFRIVRTFVTNFLLVPHFTLKEGKTNGPINVYYCNC